MTKNQGQRFSCVNCGHSYELYPPESGYSIMRLKPCDGESEDHNIKMRVECENCHKSTDVYWCGGHFYVASS